jgi:hypothetical protein
MPTLKSNLEGTEKLRELVLYIAEQSEGDCTFGMTKLNKLLFFSDFKTYLKTGRSITDQEYQKLPNGPAPRQLVPLITSMKEREELAIGERDHFGHTQKRPFALREPDLQYFSGQEIAIVDQALRYFRNMNATEISDLSHEFVGWQAVMERETIPYFSVLLDNRDLTEQEKKWGKQIDTTDLEELLAS